MFADALLYVNEEWRTNILGSLFIVFFVVLYCVSRESLKKNIYSLQDRPNHLDQYLFLAVFVCTSILDLAFHDATFLVSNFKVPSFLGWVILFVASVYMTGFFYSLCMLMSAHPKSLQATKIFLISLVPFVFIFHMMTLLILYLFNNYTHFFYEYTNHMNPFIMLIPYSLFSISWLVYFSFSSKTREYIHKK